MSDCVLWIGGSEPPDVVTRLATRRGWTVRTADPGGAADVTRTRPELIVVGTADADIDRRRTISPATLLAYCPPSTTPDAVSEAVAAGADTVLPQDADGWDAETLDQRIADAEPGRTPQSDRRVSDGAGTVGTPDHRGTNGASITPGNADEASITPGNADEASITPGNADEASIAPDERNERDRRSVAVDRLQDVTTRLFDAATPEAVADVACEAAQDLLDADVVAVRLYDQAADTLRLATATDAAAELLPERSTYAVGEGVPGTAFETERPQINPDLDDERFGEVRSVICLPLGDRGTISVGSATPAAFDEAAISLVRLLATTATAALEGADREVRTRRREAVLESIQGMVFAVDENGFIEYVSTPLAERLGEDRDDIVGEHVVAFVDVSEFSRAESLIEDGEEEVSFDIQIYPTEGDPFLAHVDVSILDQVIEGETLVGVVKDQSTLAAAREDLRREHERLWTLFENLPDPVVDAEHVEEGPVIRAANDAFAEVFDCDRDEIIGESIDEVLASPAGESAGSMPPEAINEQVREGEVTGAKVRRETARGVRTFLFRGIPYAENGGVRAFGIYTDVTEIERRERHVKVLDRLLRHNLRNDLGVVIGRAENVLDRSDDPEIRAEATDLVEAANQLIDLSDTAKRIRRIIEEPTAKRSAIGVQSLFDDVVADASDRFPAATVRAETAAADFEVLATSDLRLALEELVENGTVHGRDDPTVELRAEPFEPASTEWVDLLVVDDGPGIPETERAAVTGDRDITQLEHGSGLGLWLVRWAVESIGGDLAFERRNGRTAVRLRLRRADGE